MGIRLLLLRFREARLSLGGGYTVEAWHADVTVRLADDTHYYVYTRDKAVAEGLKMAYDRGMVRQTSFDGLEVMH